MSTKIYYGCRVRLPDGDLLGFRDRMAATVRPVYEDLYLRTVLSIAFEIAGGAEAGFKVDRGLWASEGGRCKKCHQCHAGCWGSP